MANSGYLYDYLVFQNLFSFYFRLSISRQDEKQLQTKEIILPRYCTARLKSSLFQFMFQLIRVDAETVIANLENEGIIETLIR